MKTVQDVYATLHEQRQGFPRYGRQSHPFVVFIRYTDGTTSQEIECRTLRDCLLVGGGMISALLAANVRGDCPANVVFDDRFTLPS